MLKHSTNGQLLTYLMCNMAGEPNHAYKQSIQTHSKTLSGMGTPTKPVNKKKKKKISLRSES